MDKFLKFDTKKLEKLNSQERLKWINPDLVWQKAELKSPKTLIDIGAGTGIFSREFAKKLPQGEIYACDSSEIMVDWIKENLPEKNIVPFLTEENSIDLDSEIADFIYMITVHHELAEPEKLLNEAYRLLKNGGKIAIIDWKKEEMAEGPSMEKRISEETIISQLQKVGFKNVSGYSLFPLHTFVIGEKS